ncbi:hypothetical protein PLICRDRAFT_345660 [Plicaturopsis crispa FD-325 SS-3]|uniref:Uncharacterized protein n=1 Tax=Plicaturopsis crispa FD-325 SS-3 TaxID=944288 RepID=A0A0C9T9G9_PLICR|nr:hypothetical protein PLICRDRAFT_345660 [Plicaturopsis crispa FD-325 SS-3]
MPSKGLVLLIWVIFVHSTGIYLFLRGFLLTRLALTDFTSCADASKPCTLEPTHKRAVFLVIDALRYDFIATDPPADPVSPYHHNVLTLPRELTQKYPHNSFIFNAHADPPTTTLQRIKGITTGSLPTFVDMGSNFGGSSIDEDSIIAQLRLAGKKIALMGDDTWMTVFPDVFHHNMTFPYDSFNVEDLHTVDEGVITHLMPLLKTPQSWDLIIGHFLGVDHVGHRLGPDHPTMRTKLQQMNDVLKEVIALLDDDTLLVLIGDHGMDRTGDHGGDAVLETSSGVWIYSKSVPLSSNSGYFTTSNSIPAALVPVKKFPTAPTAERSIEQIDLLPTLSLLLGLPIPFNNLGTIIPELFSRDSFLNHALEINSRQIHSYLDTYRASTAGGELDGVWTALEKSWTQVTTVPSGERLDAMYAYNRLALSVCRALWAQFNVVLMGLGLTLLVSGVAATWVLFIQLGSTNENWADYLGDKLGWSARGASGGAVIGVLGYLLFQDFRFLQGLDALDCVLFAAPFLSSLVLALSCSPDVTFPSMSTLFTPLPLLLHALSFLSNSFTVWEDRNVLFLLASICVPHVLTGLSAPTDRLRKRILGFTALFAICVRLIGWSTVCREEQGPSCDVTFFAGSSLPAPPTFVLAFAFPAAFGLPLLLRRFLAISKSHNGVTALYIPFLFTPALASGTIYWLIEYADSAELLGPAWAGLLRSVRTGVSRSALALGVLGAGALWWLIPICLEVSTTTPESASNAPAKAPKKQVTILGFGNAYGAPYLIFWCTAIGGVWLVTQLTGQLVLALGVVAVLAHLEIVDSVRDVNSLNAAFSSATPSTALDLDSVGGSWGAVRFAETIPLALLGMHMFFGTGHQASVPSIQWKTAFILTRGVVYPWSPATVVLNTFGAHVLIGLAAPLLGMWNVSPLAPEPGPATPGTQPSDSKPNTDSPRSRVHRETLRAALGVILYYSVLLLGALGAAGALRRHLMVWKVWAPRVGVAVGAWGAVAGAAVLGWGLGVGRIMGPRGVGRVLGGLGA